MTQFSWYANANTIDQGLQDFGRTENRPLQIDVADELVVGEVSPTSPAVVCYLLDLYGARETDVTATVLSGAASVSGTSIITPVIQGPQLQVGRYYELVLTHGSGTNRRSANVPFRAVE
jgi:hypothetical protein